MQYFGQLFFIWVVSKKKFTCVRLNFEDKCIDYSFYHSNILVLQISSREDEKYCIQYSDIISSQIIDGPQNTFGLVINFVERTKNGFIFKSIQQKVQSLKLFSKEQNKIKLWKDFFSQLSLTKTLSNQQIEFLQNNTYNQNEIQDFTLKNINDLENKIYFDTQIEESKNQQQFTKNQFLVFINPASGKGLAQAKWNEALQILQLSGDKYKIINTQYSGHCFDYVHKMSLEELLQYKGIILVSGDGLPHECINGIYTRKDWEQAKEIPLGILPGGSGNAFAKTLTYVSGLEVGIQNSALIIAKGQTKKIDLVLYETQQARIFSFLSFAWTYIADVDLDSEKLRFLGENRFFVYGAWKAVFQNKYAGRFYFTKQKIDDEIISQIVNFGQQKIIPNITENIGQFISNNDLTHEWQDLGLTEFTYFLITKQPFISESYHASPLCKIDDGLMDVQYLESKEGWSQLVSLALCQEEGKIKIYNYHKNYYYYNPKGTHIDSNTGRVKQGAKWNYDKISAFRLEPITSKGHYSIDGEKYDPQPIQGVVLKNCLKVFCL